MAKADRLAAEIPSFVRAAECIAALTHMPISKSSLQRLVVEHGARVVHMQAAEAAAMAQPPAKFDEESFRQVPTPDSAQMVVSLDGAMLNIRQEGWKEVKTAAIAAVEPAGVDPSGGSDASPVRLTHLSYRAGLWEAAVFADQQWAEATRRGIEKAKEVICINDGAHWIWNVVARCYQPCVEILDWWHAVEKLWFLGNLLYGEGNELVRPWVERQKDRLWSGQLRLIVHDIHSRYPQAQPLPDGLAQAVSYLFSNRHRMHYAKFRSLGYPIGSGAVESACKTVVQARMKQAGMRWSRDGAQAMLALRSIIMSNRWDELALHLSGRSKAA
jgi:hypothetical protein